MAAMTTPRENDQSRCSRLSRSTTSRIRTGVAAREAREQVGHPQLSERVAALRHDRRAHVGRWEAGHVAKVHGATVARRGSAARGRLQGRAATLLTPGDRQPAAVPCAHEGRVMSTRSSALPVGPRRTAR